MTHLPLIFVQSMQTIPTHFSNANHARSSGKFFNISVTVQIKISNPIQIQITTVNDHMSAET